MFGDIFVWIKPLGFGKPLIGSCKFIPEMLSLTHNDYGDGEEEKKLEGT